MRPPHDSSMGGGIHHSPTPIYDALYAEYRRSFKALPGDRSGEEDMGFKPFGAIGSGAREHRGAWDRIGSWETIARGLHRAGAPALPPARRDENEPGQ
ncbi:hypothetical protein AB0C51_15355 [Streptomyces pathocidini]|uniref:Uncharacterized protein n=1 Tax=Streptomyces pathocidini TaxID=1650571 RepID=A0ABW7UXD9_9ACTN|nr:hypothetical protein [Streptomyces pathocidini]